ncbi:MAG: hypothetical protein UW24_C0027G0012 [Parcubacteria group bacterium GW2011_GWA2_44_12]|nr:MAG: hypothetical protein UW24_C0027G0012 [Parcubacteria group bacterium GW2011_GWA2_44_12]
MKLAFSKFGEKLTAKTGILELMDDLGSALSARTGAIMMGGGNPAHIPKVEAIFRRRMREILRNNNEFECMLGNYDIPQGKIEFLEAVVAFFKKTYGWNITKENVVITGGSQDGFFKLFNILAGNFSNGSQKKILLPLSPEYIGYTDQGITNDFFVSYKPSIEYLDEHMFKYHVDFDKLKITRDIAALCVSRPTNPTANVLTNEEMQRLSDIAKAHQIPFIIDNAYGAPFPNILFNNDLEVFFDDHIVFSLSLSKFGLPSTRTGIMIASKEIVQAITAVNAIASLSNSSVGQSLCLPFFKNGSIVQISKNIIQPFYAEKAEKACAWIKQYFDSSLPYFVHKSEGALFLWLWFQNLPITTNELYERLKKRNVIVVAGSYFFAGIPENWKHKLECIRLNYSQSPNVEEGIRIVAEEVKKAYHKKAS